MGVLAKRKETLGIANFRKREGRENKTSFPQPSSLRKVCQVLVVDDEEPIRLLLARILEPEGYLVLLASDAAQAREIMAERHFDAVLCDLNMPGESGLDLARWIINTFRRTAVVMVSVVSDPRIAEDALGMGVHGYISKPFSAESILINVAGAIRKNKLEEENRRYRERLEQVVEERTASLRSAIANLRKTQEALRKSQESYRNLFERVPLGLFRTTPEGIILDANKALVQMLGFSSREELLKANAALLYVDPSMRLRWKKAIQSEGLVRGFQKELRRRDGNTIWVEDNTRAVKDHRGRIICFEGSIQDITRRKLMEQALKESQERLHDLFDHAPVGYFEYDRFGRIFNVNRTQQEMLGYSREEILGHYVWEFFTEPEPGRSQILAKLGGALPPASGVERYYKRKDGSVLVGLVQDRLILDGQGRVQAIRCTVQEITDRKAMEDDLRKAHDEKELLLSAISSILISVSPQGEVTQWNNTAAEAFGIPREKALGAKLEELGIKWDMQSVRNGLQRCMELRQAVRLEEMGFLRPDGKEGFLGLSLSPVGRPGEPLDGILILGADITERRILERQLVQAQKLESIGQLAAGIAHEINTPIQYIGDNTRFLRDAWGQILPVLENLETLLIGMGNGPERSPDFSRTLAKILEKTDLDYLKEEIPQAIEQNLDGVERVARIVRAMKEFSHPGKREKTAVDINRALESTITVSRNEWKYVAELVAELDPSLPLVEGDPGEINQVFLNLITNAAHAVGDTVKDGSKSKGLIRVSTHNRGSWVEVRIQDTGTGIPEAIRSRIFDPFFTTKEVGRGTGQGLAICHSVIVKKMGGSLDFETEVGKGTTFIIRVRAAHSESWRRGST